MMIANVDKQDCGNLAAIHARCFPQGWSSLDIAKLVSEPNVTALRAGTGETGGFILVRQAADEAEILTLAVDPSCRRSGFARSLLAAAEAALHEAGNRRIFLEVSDRNTAAQALYHAAGYCEAGRRSRYYSDGSDALIMEKSPLR
ncbi:ribosomal protein S18-alanine N-acetyltransferase [Hyphobacterium sp.]|uniref:ribosomal protein S18-alanine N-acetyltransferase n=1 Tax=Hyphobacterium sp. TaxID=2004662 RepID=UPI003B527ECD